VIISAVRVIGAATVSLPLFPVIIAHQSSRMMFSPMQRVALDVMAMMPGQYHLWSWNTQNNGMIWFLPPLSQI
jgi:hypothetical protein